MCQRTNAYPHSVKWWVFVCWMSIKWKQWVSVAINVGSRNSVCVPKRKENRRNIEHIKCVFGESAPNRFKCAKFPSLFDTSTVASLHAFSMALLPFPYNGYCFSLLLSILCTSYLSRLTRRQYSTSLCAILKINLPSCGVSMYIVCAHCWQWYGQMSTHSHLLPPPSHHIASAVQWMATTAIHNHIGSRIYGPYGGKNKPFKMHSITVTHSPIIARWFDEQINTTASWFLSLSHSMHISFTLPYRERMTRTKGEREKKTLHFNIESCGVTLLKPKVHLEIKTHIPINRENAHWNSIRSNQSQLQSLFITSMCSISLPSLHFARQFVFFFISSLMINFYYLPRELSSHFWPVIVDGPFHIHFKSAAATFEMKSNRIE